MTHPGPLLADYVDGTLRGADRGDVEAHLATCATCRQEVALARAARASLRSLPAAMPPPGLADAAVAEAASSTTPTDLAAARSAGPRWRWIGAAAAVAAVVVAVVVASPKLGSSPSRTAAESAAGASADVSFAGASAVDVVHADLSQQQLAAAAAALGGTQAPGEAATPTDTAAGVSGPSTSFAPAALPDLRPSQQLPERLPGATACLDRAWDSPTGELTRVVLARYEGTPAYFGVYAVGPGAGLPPTRLQLLVASVDGCQPLASAYALL